MYAAVVEFDTLTDTVRAAAKHHDFFTVGRRIRFALFFISGVHVSGVGGELCRTGIHALINRVQVILVTQLTDFRFAYARQFCQARIGKAFAFQLAQEVSVQASDAHFRHFLFQTHQLFNLYQEPAVNVGQVEDAVYGQARAESIGDIPDTLCASVFQLAADFSQRFRVVETHFRIEAGRAHFQAAQRFLQGFLLRATNRHHFANRFHLSGQTVVSTGEFFEVEARNFSNHIVDGRLEGGRSTSASDVVHQFVEGVTHRQFRRHFSNRETGRFRRQRRRTGHAWVHFDNNQTTVFRVHRKLNVGTTGFNADFTQHRHRGVTHDLIFFVGQRLGWRDSDGVTGVDAHRIEVFDRADDDAVVVFITHHFHLVLFPADQRLINQQLFGRREIQTAGANFFKLFTVISDTAAATAHGKGWANNAREAHVSGNRQRFFHRVCDTGTRGFQTNFLHRYVETTAVFCFINRIGSGTNHGDTELFQHALTFQLQRAVQRRLTAHRWQHRVRALFFNNLAYNFPVNRLDVGCISHFRVGHDGRRVGVHQNDAVTLFTQGFTRLRARVVKLTRLTDNNRARTQNQDTFYICTFWHGSFTPDYLAVLRYCSINSIKWSNNGAASCGPGLASG